MDKEEILKELERCKDSPAYFYNKYCQLKDSKGNILPKKVLKDADIAAAVHDFEEAKRIAANLYDKCNDKFYKVWAQGFDDIVKAVLNNTIASGLENVQKEIEDIINKSKEDEKSK